MKGLYLCGTPIGNLEDITLRCLRTLQEVDLIAAEDTRHTQKLLNHYEIKTPVTSYHEHNRKEKGEYLLGLLLGGKAIALVSDAGMPGISDPGYDLVCAAIAHHLPVTVVPGPSASLSALVVSGLPTEQFTFVGFLPRQKKQRQQVLELLRNRRDTLIFYEAPHRLLSTLEALLKHFGDRRVAVSRELTKKFEEIRRGTLSEVLAYFQLNLPRGEFTLIVEGGKDEPNHPETQAWEDLTVKEHLTMLLARGMDKKEAIKTVAQQRSLPKRLVYQEAIELD